MKKYLFNTVAFLFIIVFSQSCARKVKRVQDGLVASDESAIGETKYSELLPGYILLDAPNEIDKPGLIFRVTPRGQRFDVGYLKVIPESGIIEIKSFQQHKTVKLGILASFAQLDTTKIKASSKVDLNKGTQLRIKISDNMKESLNDFSLDNELKNALKIIKDNREELGRLDNRYFIIRETVSAKKMEYSLDNTSIAALGLDVSAQNKLKVNPFASWDSGKEFQLNFTYDKPLKVFYKIEYLSILSSATGQESLKRKSVTSIPYVTR